MVELKGNPNIGDLINTKIIAPLENANKLSDLPDFNDATKLGSGKEKVDRLTNLIAIFENPALDFSKNRADGDDILGDAYEYLMRHFATESGKSKGQFYTPAEVSRVMAKVVGIRDAATTTSTTVYDPTCGSGSLLLKVGDEARTKVTLYGQEKDAATAGLARMNMILHNSPTAVIVQGNTLANPKFLDHDALKTFDYVVANPPFSDKAWRNGIDPGNDPHVRFQPFGVPPAKQGDYAYLRVLFRGNAEADIRRALIRKGYIKGIIGLPPNLFLWHRHSRLHSSHRQGRRPHPQGHLHRRRQRRLPQGRQQEPPARHGHPQDRRCLQPPPRSSQILPHGRRRGDREERLQPEHPTLYR
jgi:type I restriction enzyme M protein